MKIYIVVHLAKMLLGISDSIQPEVPTIQMTHGGCCSDEMKGLTNTASQMVPSWHL